MAETVEFPCRIMPCDGREARLLGLYPQAQAGLWMQRVKVPGGAPEAGQWQALGAVARAFTPSTPLHLTTRQDIELHDLAPDRVPAVQHALAEAGLTVLGAGGDSVRNITVCPCSGIAAGRPDLLGLARATAEALAGFDGITRLPRKFKISLSACDHACAQPWINDLGFVARARQGQWRFTVVAGGSLGSRPATAISVTDQLEPRDVVPMALAAVSVFAAHGNRADRRHARLRHVRENLGDQAFLAMLRGEFDGLRSQRRGPDVELREPQRAFASRATLAPPNGDLLPAEVSALGALAQRQDLRVRIANQHRVLIWGDSDEALTDALNGLEALAPLTHEGAAIVACPGKRWCRLALVDTNALADLLRERLAGAGAARASVCISGCPNGCAQSAVADVGLVGAVAMRDGRCSEAFDLYVGGGMGKTPKLADLAGRKLAPEEVVAAVGDRYGAR